MSFTYPSKQEIDTDGAKEDKAVKTAMSAMLSVMQDAVADAPLDKPLLVYAAIELAFHLEDAEYVEEVFNEVLLRRGMKVQ